MTAIQPNSTIVIGRSALRRGGEDTYYWENATVQRNNIMYEEMRTWNECSYQRERRNYIRVSGNAEDFDGCNYLCFRNINYDHQVIPKWYYAFVLNVDYINNETMEIHYEIDTIQTYFFDYHENTCYVERIHSLTDNIGDNYLPETIETGEYVTNGDSSNALRLFSYEYPWYVVIQIGTLSGEEGSCIVDGIYQGVHFFAYPVNINYLPAVKDKLEHNNPDNIIDIYIVPGMFVYGNFVGGTDVVSGELNESFLGFNNYFHLANMTDTTTIDGYQPKNNKLYTYPYNFLDISNGTSESMALRYEFFNGSCYLRISGTVSSPCECVVYPCGYKGTTAASGTSSPSPYLKESIMLPSLPHCSWTYDTFKTWLSQAAIPVLMGAATAAATSQVPPILMGVASRLTNRTKNGNFDYRHNTYVPTTPNIPQASAIGVGALLTQGYSASIKNLTQKGSSSTLIPVSANTYGVWCTRMSVTAQYAKMIDDYFTLYGYATNSLMSATQASFRKRRTRFTYIKTIGASINGQIPGDAMIDICSRYDSGVRFWADYENMYNYTYDNTLL